MGSSTKLEFVVVEQVLANTSFLNQIVTRVSNWPDVGLCRFNHRESGAYLL